MAKVYDIATDSAGELLIKDGDFAIEESTVKHTHDILVSNKGNYKHAPLLGVAIDDFLLDDVAYGADLKRVIMEELESDGQEILNMNTDSIETIEIVSEYKLAK